MPELELAVRAARLAMYSASALLPKSGLTRASLPLVHCLYRQEALHHTHPREVDAHAWHRVYF